MSTDYEKHDRYHLDGGCPSFVTDEMDVSVPITIRAKAEVRDVELCCLGDTHIIKHHEHHEHHEEFKFTIHRKLKIEIPCIFSAEADVGEARVRFEEPKVKDGPHKKCKHREDEDDDDFDFVPLEGKGGGNAGLFGNRKDR